MHDIRELSLTELDCVSGGMSCQTGHAIADFYRSVGDACRALGNEVQANRMYGKGTGVAAGACQ